MLRKIGRGIITGIVILLLSVAGLLALSLFSVFGLRSFVVQSGSMEPALATGSIVFVFPTKDYIVGDIVTRTTDNSDVTVTHRIVGKTEQAGGAIFTLKGDANEVKDGGEVRRENILGKVVLDIPYLGFVVDYVKRPQGFILFIVIPAVLIIYGELQKIQKEISLLWSRRKRSREPEIPEQAITFVERHPPRPAPVSPPRRKIV